MVAKMLLAKESPLIKYLKEEKALKFVYRKKTNMLNCYAEEKKLLFGQMKYPEIFGRKGKIGFMELYISHIIKKQMMLAKGSM